jgi:hypothetical protein
MTESIWLTENDLRPMLWLAGHSGELRHFAAACVRMFGYDDRHTGTLELWPEVLDAAEHLARGSATPDAFADLQRRLDRVAGGLTLGRDLVAEASYGVQCRLLKEPFTCADAEIVATFALNDRRSVIEVYFGDGWPAGGVLEPFARELEMTVGLSGEAFRWRVQMHLQQAMFARDVIGNPFRPVAFDPSWRTSTVVALAEGIDREYAFDRLPLLADALTDAGCNDEHILEHCRSDGPHVRGCWVVELVLGRSFPSGAGDLRLVGLTAECEGRLWTFADQVEVGRRTGQFLADSSGTALSRRHATMFRDPHPAWWVADRGSTNGSFLNGVRIGEQPAGPLRAGDMVQFANFAFRVVSAGGSTMMRSPAW